MRIFSGDSGDIPLVKYWLFRHKHYMEACGLSTFRSVRTLPDGRQLVITSLEGIDNIVLSPWKMKKPLEEFILPKELQGQAYLWAGACGYPDSVFENLQRFWGCPISRELLLTDLTTEHSLVFVAPLNTRQMYSEEIDRIIQWKAETNGKVIFHLGEDDDTIMSRINGVLIYMEHPFRITDSFVVNDYTISQIYTEYHTDYAGKHMRLNFNGYEKPFIINGFPKSVYAIFDHEDTLSGWGKRFVGFSTLWDGPFTSVFDGSCVAARVGFDFPKLIKNPYTHGMVYEYLSTDFNPLTTDPWHVITERNTSESSYDWSSALEYWNDSYGDYGWDAEPQIAHYDNVMVFATGNDWFSHDRVLDRQFSNVEFILALLLEEWQKSESPMKMSLHFGRTGWYDYATFHFNGHSYIEEL